MPCQDAWAGTWRQASRTRTPGSDPHEDCEFDSPLTVEGAQLYELALTGCIRLPGLLANGVRIRRDLDLSRTHVTGTLRTAASTSKRAAKVVSGACSWSGFRCYR